MESAIGNSVYNFIELVGTSNTSWEEAVSNALACAGETLTNMRIAEVVKMDALVSEGQVIEHRVLVRLSFKHEIEPETL
jgi:flavin-binding protein dodecin